MQLLRYRNECWMSHEWRCHNLLMKVIKCAYRTFKISFNLHTKSVVIVLEEMMMGLSCLSLCESCFYRYSGTLEIFLDVDSYSRFINPPPSSMRSNAFMRLIFFPAQFVQHYQGLKSLYFRFNSEINSKSLALMCLGIRTNFCLEIKWESFQIFNLLYLKAQSDIFRWFISWNKVRKI